MWIGDAREATGQPSPPAAGAVMVPAAIGYLSLGSASMVAITVDHAEA
jgi:hypothetical protein